MNDVKTDNGLMVKRLELANFVNALVSQIGIRNLTLSSIFNDDLAILKSLGAKMRAEEDVYFHPQTIKRISGI